MSQAPRIVAQVLDYEEVVNTLRARVEALACPYDALEDAMGLSRGYLGKILGLARIKQAGPQMFIRICETIGYRLVVVEHLDIEATRDELGEFWRAVQSGQRSTAGKLRKQLSPAILTAAAQQYGAMGRGKQKTFRISRRKLSALRRRAARARWYKEAKPTKAHVGVSRA